ncbi:MAG: hypothetical protein K9H12_13450 [Bacteroidales bacterium]|nr:hypothetical protein [Bacteroidales bacterium]
MVDVDISSAGLVYEWVITDYVKSLLADDKTISVSLGDLGAMGETIQFSGKESAANIPKLNILINANYSSQYTIGTERGLFKIYSNSAQGLFCIENANGTEFSYEIDSVQRKMIASGINIEYFRAEVDLSGIEQRIYFVLMETINGRSNYMIVIQYD